MFFIYLLYSPSHHRSYVGQTKDLAKRLERHNRRMVPSTKSYAPWVLVWSQAFNTRAEAMQMEKWLKSGVGRARVKELLAAAGYTNS
jgi:putative endonuclease